MCSSSHTETENDPVIQILCDFFKSFGPKKKQMGYNNPFEILSLSAKKNCSSSQTETEKDTVI